MTADRIDIVDVVDSGDGLRWPHAMGYLRSELRLLFRQLEREYLEGLLYRSRTRVNHQSIGFDLMSGVLNPQRTASEDRATVRVVLRKRVVLRSEVFAAFACMDRTSPLGTIASGDLITTLGHRFVQITPQRHQPRKVHHRSKWP